MTRGRRSVTLPSPPRLTCHYIFGTDRLNTAQVVLGISDFLLCMIQILWLGWPLTRVIRVREAPFWNVFVLYGQLGIAQKALDATPLCQTGEHGKKVLQAILGSLYTPAPLRAMSIWKQHISKRGFPNQGDQGGIMVKHIFWKQTGEEAK